MKHCASRIALMLLLVLPSCATSLPEGIEEPLIQIHAAGGQFMPSVYNPEIEIVTIATVYNRNSREIELREIQFRSTGTISIQLRSEVRRVGRTIPPKSSIDVELRTFARTDSRTRETGPVRLRGTAIFQVDESRFRQVFTTTLR